MKKMENTHNQRVESTLNPRQPRGREQRFCFVRNDLKSIVEQLDHGELLQMPIHRSFCWSEDQVKALLDSMLDGKPAGVLLLRGSGYLPGPFPPIHATNKKKKPFAGIVLDGVQRLAAIAQAFLTPGWGYDCDLEQFVKTADEGQHLVPLPAMMGGLGDHRWSDWVAEHHPTQSGRLFESAHHAYTILRRYEFAMRLLDGDTPYDEVIEIYRQEHLGDAPRTPGLLPSPPRAFLMPHTPESSRFWMPWLERFSIPTWEPCGSPAHRRAVHAVTLCAQVAHKTLYKSDYKTIGEYHLDELIRWAKGDKTIDVFDLRMSILRNRAAMHLDAPNGRSFANSQAIHFTGVASGLSVSPHSWPEVSTSLATADKLSGLTNHQFLRACEKALEELEPTSLPLPPSPR